MVKLWIDSFDGVLVVRTLDDHDVAAAVYYPLDLLDVSLLLVP